MPARSQPPTALIDELRALYAEVDALYSGISCPASTECCRFGITGRQPYVTSIELAAIERAIARRGGRATLRSAPLPLARDDTSARSRARVHPRSRQTDERCCPLLDRAGRCTVYADRPFGCRTFFCSRATGGPAPHRRELRDLLRRLQSLAARHRTGGDIGQALESALEA